MQLLQNQDMPRDDTVPVGTSVVQIIKQANYGQQVTAIVLTNTSTSGQTISLGFGKDAVANSGIVLSPGGIWFEVMDSAFLPTNWNITGISSAASGSIAVHYRNAKVVSQ
jgi:hypothetical protein